MSQGHVSSRGCDLHDTLRPKCQDLFVASIMSLCAIETPATPRALALQSLLESRFKVVDAVRFPAQANGVASGRFPDGASGYQELEAQTPGTANAEQLLAEPDIDGGLIGGASLDADGFAAIASVAGAMASR